MRRTGIDAIVTAPWGTHFCQFYQDRQDLVDILVPYFKAGLEDNEYCLWVASEPLGAEDARAALGGAVDNLEACFRRGQIEIVNHRDWYAAGGEFDACRVLRAGTRKLEEAKRRGFAGLRVCGETLPREKYDSERFRAYEAAVESAIGGQAMIALCTYNLARCGAVEIVDAVSNHGFALIKRSGKWQIIESAERKRIEAALEEEGEMLRRLNRTLQARSRSNQALIHATDEASYLEEVCRIVLEDCGYPMAWVGFREHDEAESIRIASHSGFEDGYLERLRLTWGESERGLGPGGTAIRTGRPAVCRDASTDPRFAPWREEASRRGYVCSIALPLLDGGEAFGALSIYSRLPDAFTDDEVHLLSGLAADFAYGIKMLRLRADHENAEKKLRQASEQRLLALEAADLGAWDFSLETGGVFWDERCRQMFGFRTGDRIDYQEAVARVHPDDRAAMEAAVKRAIAGFEGGAFHNEHRVILPNGSVRWIASHGRVHFSGAGEDRRAARLTGVNLEITDRKRAEEALREQREWLGVTLRSIGDGVVATDTCGRITFLNPVASRLTGWEQNEALGLPVQEVFRIVNEQSRERADDLVARVLREGRVVTLDSQSALVRRDGSEVPIEDSAAPIRDAAGNLAGIVLVFHDVTEKRAALEALSQSEQRVRLKLDSILSPQGDIGALELEDIIDAPAIQSMMEDFYRVAGIPVSIGDHKGRILVSVGWQDVCTRFHRVHPDSCRNCRESDTELTAGIELGESRLYRCKNGMCDVATPIAIGGRHMGNIFSGQFFMADEPVDYEVFRAQASRYGFDETEYLAALEAAPRLSRETVGAAMAFLAKFGQTLSRLSYSNIRLARLLSEREQLMDSLRRAQSIARVGSWELDLATNRLSWSDEVHRIFGLEPQKFAATYEAFLDAVHPDDRAAVDAAYSDSLRDQRASYELTHRIVRQKTGEVRWVHEKCDHFRDANGNVVRSCGMVQDITERKQAEDALRQAQKMESIGLLAGGIAHDFNNLLVGIIGNASLAADIGPPGPVADILSEVVKAGEHAAHLTRQLLAYAGKGRFMVEPIDLSRLVDNVRSLIESTISKKIALEVVPAPGIATVESDRSQMQQVIMNLALNAAEAIGDEPGRISIFTGEVDADETAVRDQPGGWEMGPGRYVFVEVRDTGCGMNETTRARIFDPFFTTKFQGRGLGLAAVAGIVRSHKGGIAVTSSPGKGTTFRVLLPSAGASERPDTPLRERDDDLRGEGTILVIDDEQIVRDLAKHCLERHGYEVLVAENGAAAVETVRAEGHRVQLAVLDLSMPDMSGAEALPRLRELRPDLPVVVSSGYSEQETLRLFRGRRISGFIQKPYSSRDLARKIKGALGAAAAARGGR